MRLRALSCVLFVAVLCCGCGSSQLTRAKAKELIDASPKFSPASEPHFKITDATLAAGVLKFWVYKYGTWGPLFLNSEGEKYFTGVGPLFGFGEPAGTLGVVMKPMRRHVVAVTGIGDGPTTGAKFVKFEWEWTDVPQPVKDVVGAELHRQASSALMGLYDDGWRVEGIR